MENNTYLDSFCFTIDAKLQLLLRKKYTPKNPFTKNFLKNKPVSFTSFLLPSFAFPPPTNTPGEIPHHPFPDPFCTTEPLVPRADDVTEDTPRALSIPQPESLNLGFIFEKSHRLLHHRPPKLNPHVENRRRISKLSYNLP
ncbi:hypothetical protein CDAR_369441 [Caerostris darwini]|uniref:Uncharacterized protein n=1 Tax=Caerostris darwini TaxID=1538125 RepID=A0AAV4RZ45_9ARAC|nr:hypothetical protein CDAR_369441 [Caerostris darwini]